MISLHDKLPNPIQKIGEYQIVKTPEVLAEQVLDSFPNEVWSKTDKKWLVPVSKTGVFEVSIYGRLMKGLGKAIPNWEERRNWIIREMIWSFVGTPACELIVCRSYLGKAWDSMREFEELEGNVGLCNFLKATIDKEGRVMAKKNGKEEFVKFDYIVGNPPYQDNSKANDPKNIYPDFVLKAIQCKPEYMSMVIPARWLMGSGKGAGEFLEFMLKSKSLSKIVVEKDSSKWFPDVSIMGGIMYLLYKQDHNSTICGINGNDFDLAAEDTIITDVVGLGVKSKVMAVCDKTFDEVMLGGCPFGITSTHNEWSKTLDRSYTCHNSGKGDSAKTCFVSKELVKRNIDCIDRYKVCTSKGYGSDGISKPFVIGPDHIVSESYLVLSFFDSEQHANNAAGFLTTQFSQYLISLLKNTQNVAKRVFKYLPYLDFTRSYTDKDLYTMFALSPEEIVHIETTTKDFPIFRAKRNEKKAA